MAKKMCKCAVCNEEFDRNSIQAVKYGGRRYAHYSCYPEGELVPMEKPKNSNPDMDALTDYIKTIYKDKANWVLIKKQIKDYEKKGYSLTGILSTLKYIFEVKHNSVDKTNGGIGLVDFMYAEAKDYYYKIWLAQHQNENKTFISKVKEYIIKPPKKKKLWNEISWGEEDNEE